MAICKQQFLPVALALLPLIAFSANEQSKPFKAGTDYDRDAALKQSQTAIGGSLGDHQLTDTSGNPVRISDYAGKPLLISLIFTSCYHACPVTTRRLKKAVEAAREVLDEDSFHVATIGFDTSRDTPENMRVFAREQNIDLPGWDFLSGSPETIASVIDELGFVHFPSPRGFDHITQVTVIDRDGVIYRQVYGEMFELPWLVEPLKDLVFNRPQSAGHFMASLFDRVRLFCTIYDPSTGRYEFDYSLFVQIAVGLTVILGISAFLVREYLRARRK